ncbi:hypothetical protein GCM10009830_04060 [Glycomyces endophyticus]|uniref:HTH cro/C1-type domain-containing protein n=1 Tax=Glycomyces endophyticus TaxID=480996 RepID=A0ABP4RZM1_9ACTN
MIRLKLMRWLVAILMQDARVATGMSQKEAARAFRVSPGTIYNWERGIHHPPHGMIARIAEVYRIDAELRFYVELILEANDFRILEARPRLHAIALSKAEQHAGIIFKHEPQLVHGPLQTRDYHFIITQPGDGSSDADAQKGWIFKDGRQDGLYGRTPLPLIRYLMGDSAIYGLRQLPEEPRREQLTKLLAKEALPGTEIRVMAEFHPGRNTQFEIFEPGTSETAPPTFVYSEILHGSWCIEEDAVVAEYHRAGKAMWLLGIPLKEFLNEYCRDLLA